MIYIISGVVNEGKTGRMVSIYNRLGQGDGFVSTKIFANRGQEEFCGYEIRRLNTGEKKVLAFKAAYVPGKWDEACCFGPFCFSRAAFEFAESIIVDILQRGVEPIFIDEIGPLELSGGGFSTILQDVLKTGQDVYISVRNHCVQDVLEKFNIREYRIKKVSEIDNEND
ncbi:MAG: hypothetical protein KAW12_31250 [Candidatus Aminicenantes bacterium]|nr:hypothetical protein [Candidatus Aminicenantes bacterium]